jgi:anti-sigma factor (TIGR02949 family)
MAQEKKKNNCKEVFALLSQYLDAELTPEACEDIEKHLAGCPPCIEFLNTLRRTVKLCHCCNPAEQLPPVSDAQLAELRAAYQKMLQSKR